MQVMTVMQVVLQTHQRQARITNAPRGGTGPIRGENFWRIGAMHGRSTGPRTGESQALPPQRMAPRTAKRGAVIRLRWYADRS